MPEGTIRRSVQLAIQHRNVFVQDVTIAGKAAETAFKGIGTAADAANQNLEKSTQSVDRFSRQGRYAFANLGNQVQDFVVQVQGGTDAFRAASQQLPQALDAFAGFIPVLPLIGAGVAIALPLIGSLIERMFNLGGAQKEAAADAARHKQELDSLSQSFGLSAENAQKYQTGLKVLSDQEKDLLNVSLRSAIQADQQQLDSLADQIKRTARGLTSAADIPDVQAPGGGPTVPLSVTDPELANLRDYAKTTRELIDNYQQGNTTFTAVTDAIERLSIMTGESDRVRAKEIDGLKDEVEQHEAAQRAVDLHKAQYHLLLEELGETGAFTEADRTILNHTETIKEATQALLTFGTANRMNVIESTSALIAKTDPQAAEQYRTQKIDELAKLTKSLQDAADRNAIRLRTGLDVGDAEKIRSQLDAAGKKTSGTLDEDIKNIKAAGEALISTGADAGKMQAAENELIREAVDKRNQVAAAALKEREEQALITAGVARTKQEADALLASNSNVLAGLTGQAKITAEINRLIAERAALSGPEEADRRANIDQQINNLQKERNDLSQKDVDKENKYIEQGDKVIEQLKTQLQYKSAANQITEEDIKAAGETAAAKVPTVPPELARGADGAALQRQYEQRITQARELGEAAKTEEFWTKANADAEQVMNAERAKAVELANKVLPPQQKLNDTIEALKPLLDGTAEGQERFNAAVARYIQLQPLEERKNQQRERQAEIDRLAMSENPFDWTKAGFKEIEAEADDTGRTVAGLLKSGFDSENHAFFELVAGQKQGWSDMKSAALDFVSTLGEVALKELEIMAVSRTIGFIGGLFGGAGASPSEGDFLARDSLISAYGHNGLRVGGEGGTASAIRIPAAFAKYLPRFHRGGMAPDERIIVVQTGEQILNREEARNYQRARKMHSGGVVDDSGSSSRAHQWGPSQVVYSPTTNNYFSGVLNEEHTAAVINASSAKANKDFVRMTRNSPDFRRAIGR